ncbi:single-stranded DNA-binding protein [Dyella sp.]|uniref:single-stranded DNA-binding protein n=1 Tax=Dyella sp. TaxID=1869338 RepID=UPI002846B59F|nr:single-stranded DNA-binding protein [Dyella sp.]MDR3445731.1 single-stranded DNA-binding protein [Dyella sp.]
MASLNKVCLIGNLGADPETRYSGSGTAITNIRIATTEKWTDKQSGEKKEETEWHRITFFGRQAEVAGEYLKKGSSIYIEGRLKTDKYTDKDGVERYPTGIIASELKMLSGGNGGGQQSGGQRQAQQGGGTQRDYGQRQSPPPVQNNDFDDDDIPF